MGEVLFEQNFDGRIGFCHNGGGEMVRRAEHFRQGHDTHRLSGINEEVSSAWLELGGRNVTIA